MFQSKYVVLCATVVRLGAFLFGYGRLPFLLPMISEPSLIA